MWGQMTSNGLLEPPSSGAASLTPEGRKAISYISARKRSPMPTTVVVLRFPLMHSSLCSTPVLLFEDTISLVAV